MWSNACRRCSLDRAADLAEGFKDDHRVFSQIVAELEIDHDLAASFAWIPPPYADARVRIQGEGLAASLRGERPMENQSLGFECLDRLQVAQCRVKGLRWLKQGQHLVVENTPGRENGVTGPLPEVGP